MGDDIFIKYSKVKTKFVVLINSSQEYLTFLGINGI